MDYGIVDDKFKYIEGYNYTLSHEQSEKLAIIIRNLLNYLASDVNILNSYQVITNLGYRLLGGDYSTVRVMYGNYEKLLATDKKDIILINLYEKILSLITVNKFESIPISSINVRNGNFNNVSECEEVNKPVLVVSHSKKMAPTLELKRQANN